MAGGFDVLGLRARAGAPEPGPPPPESPSVALALRPLIDRLLILICETLSGPDPGAQSDDFRARINEQRLLLSAADDPDRIVGIGETILAICKDVLENSRNERIAARTEIPSLIALVREAVTTIAGEGSAFCASVTDSATRFDALRHISDMHQLKQRLAVEVGALKQLAQRREMQWRSKVSTFENRIVMLEQQLLETREQASHDPLTGVANRRRFQAAFRELQARRRQVVVALFDLDDFKAINDSFGHGEGDKALVAVAERLKASVRSEDIVARMGGDEFALLMLDVTLPLAERRLRAIIAALAATPVGGEGEGGRLTTSCGIAEYSAGDTLESLMHRADQALYDAKRMGKNRVASRSTPFIRDLRQR